MARKRPTTIDQYIESAPPQAQRHLRRLHAILTRVAPEASQVIKWGAPFYVEPRFLFAFFAHKNHLNFTPNEGALEVFRKELEGRTVTKGSLQVRYDEPLPEKLIRRIAEHRVRVVSERDDDSFW